EIERLRRHYCHRVQRIQFAVPPLHLVFSAALLRHIQHKALVALDHSSSAASSEAALRGQQQGPVLASQGDIEIAHQIVAFKFFAEGLALLGIDADLRLQIEYQQL